MSALFSELHRARLWRQLWIWLAEEEKKLGLPVTASQIQELKKYQNEVDLKRVRFWERKLKHDVMSHIKAYGEQASKAEKIIHLGATSCYVTDNSDVLIMREATELILKKLAKVISELNDRAKEWKSVVASGYTHFQPAQPVTMGKRLCLWLQDLIWDFEELVSVQSRLEPLGCKGATGTQASFMVLFDGDFKKVRELDRNICKKMGFDNAVKVSGQTLSRKIDTWYLSSLANLAGSFSKLSQDFRLLQHTGELREPFGKSQVGSSAMAYKQNPILAERMTSLSRFAITLAQNAYFTHGSQWLERSLDDSANRRLSLAQSFLTLDALCEIALRLFKGMSLGEEKINEQLNRHAESFATEEAMMRAVLLGQSRQEAHEEVRKKMLSGKLKGNPKSIFCGAAKEQTDAFIKERSMPFLKKHRFYVSAKLEGSAEEI